MADDVTPGPWKPTPAKAPAVVYWGCAAFLVLSGSAALVSAFALLSWVTR